MTVSVRPHRVRVESIGHQRKRNLCAGWTNLKEKGREMKVFARPREMEPGGLVTGDGRGLRSSGARRRTFTCRYTASDTYLGHTGRLTFKRRKREALAQSRRCVQKKPVGYDYDPWSLRTWGPLPTGEGKYVTICTTAGNEIGPPRQLTTGCATVPATSVVSRRVHVPTTDSGAVIYEIQPSFCLLHTIILRTSLGRHFASLAS